MAGISDRLRLVRTRLGYTQKEMAGVLEVAYRTLQDNERALVQPGAATLAAYAAIGVDLNWLVTGLERSQRTSLAPPVDELRVKKKSVVEIGSFPIGTTGMAKKSDGDLVVISKKLLPVRGRGTAKSDGLVWVTQPDTAMAPKIPKGAKLFVDVDPEFQPQTGVYLFKIDNGYTARHMTLTEDGYVIVMTATGNIESVHSASLGDQPEVVGRVIAVVHSV